MTKITPDNAKSLLRTWENFAQRDLPIPVKSCESMMSKFGWLWSLSIKNDGVTTFFFCREADCMTFFSMLNDICQSFSHLDRAFKSSWRIWLSIGPVIVRYLIVVTKCKAISSDISLKKEAMTERKLKVSLKRFKYLAKTFMLYQAAVYFSSPSVRRLNVTHPFRSTNTDSPYTFPLVDSVFFK